MSKGPAAFPRHVPPHAHGRLATASVLGVATALLIPARLGLALRLLAAWDVAALVMASFAWMIILHAGPHETHKHAGAHDPGRRAVSVLVILTSCVSLLATAVILRQARAQAPEVRDLFVVLCVLAVASAWLLTHSAYALRYAHLYYRDDDEGVGGLTFPGDAAPCYLDFAYFAFTIGMCFQVSDVSVPSRQNPPRRPRPQRAVLSLQHRDPGDGDQPGGGCVQLDSRDELQPAKPASARRDQLTAARRC